MADPREMTIDECRTALLQQLDDLASFWIKNEVSKEEAVRGVVFSFLALIDGENGTIPGMILTPCPHPSDKQYHIDHGENWWPVLQNTEPLVDISDGELHSRWASRSY